MESFWYLLISAASFTGFAISLNIWKKKRTKKPFACPLRFRCETVVHSSYSKLLGIPLEYLGLLYYGLIFVSYLSFFLFPEIVRSDRIFVYSVSIATIIAFVVSIYLTFVQAFLLKEWCSLCLVSALMCTIIFISVLKISQTVPLPF